MFPAKLVASLFLTCCLLSAQEVIPDSLAIAAARVQARSCQSSGQLEPALAAWERVLQLAGEDAMAREARCELLRRAERFAEALVELEAAMPLAESYLERAFLRALCGRPEAAVADFQRAHELRGDVYGALYLWIWSDEVTALQAFSEEPGWQGELARFGLGLSQAAELVQAARESTDASMRAERLCEAYACLGMVAERAGRRADAEEYYLACVQTGVTRFIEYRWARDRLTQD